MAFESGFADGGPAAALALVARRLGRPAELAALRERFFQHTSPQSLRALVEVSGELGLAARALRGDLAGLGEVSLPAVLHLRSPATGEEGFAVLAERRPGGWIVEEGTLPDRHELTSRELERFWTGIVVTFSAAEGTVLPAARRAGPLRRALGWLRGGGLLEPVHEVAGRIALFGCLALSLGGAVRAGSAAGGTRAGAAAATAAALNGLGAYLARELYSLGRRAHVPSGPSRLASMICKRGTRADCLGVLASRWASVLGVDLASAGVAFFASNLALLAVAAVVPAEAAIRLLGWSSIAFLLAAPASLFLVGVQVYPLRRFCPLCMAVQAVVLACAAASFVFLVGPGRGALDPVGLAPFALLHAVTLAGAFGLLLPFLGLSLETRAHRARLGWIGATPWGALAEIVGRPRAVSRVPPSAFRLGAAERAPFRLDAVVHPLCPGCGPVVDKLEILAGRHADRLAVSLHFPPRDLLSHGDRELCAALYAAALVGGAGAGLELYREAKQRPWPLLREAEADAAELLRRRVGQRAGIEEALADGRESVKAAQVLYDEIQRGTPTVLLDGKPWESSIEDLDAVLTRFPDLLATVLRVSPAGRASEREAPA